MSTGRFWPCSPAGIGPLDHAWRYTSDDTEGPERGDRMRRRELMLLVGGAMTAAAAHRAQEKAMPVIGFLSATSPEPLAPFVAAFRHGLSESGYVERQNVTIEYRWAEGHYDRLPALAADLVGRKVDV